jgi:hypothetical protein
VGGFLYICTMNYGKIYDDLIVKAKSENRIKGGEVYYESHHIIPECMGGEGTVNQWRTHPNIVLLNAKEHFIAHKLLVNIHPNNQGLKDALVCFLRKSKSQKRNEISSRDYDMLKNIRREVFTQNNPMKNENAKQNQSEMMLKRYENNPDLIIETRERFEKNKEKNPEKFVGNANKNGKLSEFLKVNNPMFRPEVVEKFRGPNNHQYGIPRTEEQKKKQSEKMIGKMVGSKNPMTNPEVAKKSGLARKGKKQPTTTCPYCSIIGSVTNLKRYHFENCKSKL